MINNKPIERAECFRAIVSDPISFGFKPNDAGTEIISVVATVRTRDVKADSGECVVYSTASFDVIQKNESGVIVQDDYAVDFEMVFKNEKIDGKAPLGITYSVNDVKYELHGDEYLISAIIDSEASFCNMVSSNAISSIDDAVVKSERINTVCEAGRYSATGDFEGEKEYPFEISALISHEERVRLARVTAQTDVAVIEGEILVEFLCLTKRGEFLRECFSVPFSYEAECDGIAEGDRLVVFAETVGANYRIENSDDGKNSTLIGTFSVSFKIAAFRSESVNVVVDAFSKTHETDVEREEIAYTSDAGICEFKHKCFGEAVSDKGDDYVVGVVNCTVDAFDYRKEGGKLKPSGLIRAELLVRSKDGGIHRAKAELPFSCQFDCSYTPADVAVVPRFIAVKELDGKCVTECELLFSVAYFSDEKATVLGSVCYKDELPTDGEAIQIVFVEKGEDAWSVCKKARVSEEDLFRQNPELRFPIEKPSGIVVYKKINMDE